MSFSRATSLLSSAARWARRTRARPFHAVSPTRSAPEASSWSAWDAFSAPDWRSGVVVVTVLGGTFTAVFEAGRLHKSVAELEPKVQQVQASVDALRADVRADVGALRADVRADMDALRADVRADVGALRVSSDKLNDKMDQLLLSFLPKSK